MNGLRSVEVLLASQAILVGPGTPDPRRADLAAELITMLEAVVAGRRVKYLMMNAPRAALGAIEEILPGLESPSVIPLAHADMVAVHAVVPSDQVHAILSRLRTAGASGILVVPVEKLLP
jgi:ATP phosphoribosyltransferase